MGECLCLSLQACLLCSSHGLWFPVLPRELSGGLKSSSGKRRSTQHLLLEDLSHILNQENDDKGPIQVEVTLLPTKSQGAGRGESVNRGKEVLVLIGRYLVRSKSRQYAHGQ